MRGNPLSSRVSLIIRYDPASAVVMTAAVLAAADPREEAAVLVVVVLITRLFSESPNAANTSLSPAVIA